MKKFIFAMVLAGLGLSFSHTVAFACGDKLLVLGRGVRFQRAFAAVHPASILLFARRASAVPAAMKDFEATLKDAGHKLQTVEDSTKLAESLKTGKYDLVLVDVADAAALEQDVQSSPSKPMMLPLSYNATKTEVTSAEGRFGSLLKIPSKNGQYLATIDRAMELRTKGARKVS
jgi:hypothetical protein